MSHYSKYIYVLIFFLVGLSNEVYSSTCLQRILESNTEGTWVAVRESSVLPLTSYNEIQNSIRAMIKSAEESILIEIFALTDPSIVKLLRKKASDGVKIKIITTSTKEKLISKQISNSRERILKALQHKNIELVYYPSNRLQRKTNELKPHNHKKLIIVDNRTVYTGSANISTNKSGVDFGVVIRNKDQSALTNRFRRDWRDAKRLTHAEFPDLVAKKGNKAFKIVESRDTRDVLLAEIKRAKKSIVIANYHLKDEKILEALQKKIQSNKNFSIRLLLGPREANYNFYGVPFKRPFNYQAKMVKGKNVELKWYNQKKDGSTGILHGKLAIFDEKTTYVGTSDFNSRSFDGNLELGLLFNSRDLSKQFISKVKTLLKEGKDAPLTKKGAFYLGRTIDFLERVAMNLNRKKRLSVDRIDLHSPYALKIYIRRLKGRLHAFKKRLTRKYIKDPPARADRNSEDALQAIRKELLAQSKREGREYKIVSSKEIGDSGKREGKIVLFAGYSRLGADRVISKNLDTAQNGAYGSGIYLTNSSETAFDYARWRSSQIGDRKTEAHLITFLVDKKRVLNLGDPATRKKIELWGKNNSLSSKNGKKLRLERRYASEHDFQSIRFPGVEGKGKDFYLILSGKHMKPDYHLIIR